MKKKLVLSILILIVFLSISLYKIDKIPGEWFGDISNVHEYVTQILEGKWPFYFFQSPGPFYHYLIAPIILLFRNHGYETYKIASILVSFLGLLGTFLFIKEIEDIKLALVAALVMSVSFWFLIWSRLGNSQIVIPALSSFMSFFLAKYINGWKFRDVFFGGLIASLGWYTYPQTFIFPFIFISIVFLNLIFKRKLKGSILSFIGVAILMVLLFIPFLNIVKRQPGNFEKGYIGQKILPVLSMPSGQIVNKFVSNLTKTILMFHIKGDGTFRVNVSGHPQMDRISGIVMFGGLLYFLNKRKRVWFIYILGMMTALILPSISPSISEGEIPSSSRTIAITPFVFLLVAAGFLWIYRFLKSILTHLSLESRFVYSPPFEESRFPLPAGRFSLLSLRRLATCRSAMGVFAALLVSLILAYMTFLNIKLYFVDYKQGLPDRNLAPGKLIARYIDENFSSDVSLYFASCCWGEWGEPEPKAVVYVIRKSRNYIDHNIGKCEEVTSFPAVVIFSPNDQHKISLYQKCFPYARLEKIYMNNGEVLYQQLIVNNKV